MTPDDLQDENSTRLHGMKREPQLACLDTLQVTVSTTHASPGLQARGVMRWSDHRHVQGSASASGQSTSASTSGGTGGGIGAGGLAGIVIGAALALLLAGVHAAEP